MGEEVRVLHAATVPVGEDAYVVEILNEAFVRGSTGEARLVFHNTGDVTVELMSATSAGSQPSTEVGFTLSDPAGGPLSSAQLQQATGEGVVQLASKTTVARIEPGASWTSDPVTVPVPSGAPDDVDLRVTLDLVHYHHGQADHVAIPGPTTSRTLSLVEPPYEVTVTSATPEVSKGEVPIVVTGQALDAETGDPVPDVPLTLFISVSGFERTFDLFTDATGAWSYAFEPLENEGGVYQVWANFPDLDDKSVEATFTIQRVFVTPQAATITMAANYPHTVPVKVETVPGTTLTNLRFDTGVLPSGLTVEGPVLETVPGDVTVDLPLTLTADNAAPTVSAIQVDIVSDEGTWATLPVSYVVSSADPVLKATPPGLTTGVARGEAVNEQLTLTNVGLAKFDDLTLTLEGPSWGFLASAASVGDLAVGAETVTTVMFAPTDATPLSVVDPYLFELHVTAAGEPVTTIPLYVYVDDSGTGAHLFKVVDIYTGTFDEQGAVIQGLAGAKVEVDKLFGSVHNATLYTDALGEAFFPDLPVGTYEYRVSASGHDPVSAKLTVKPGVTGADEVFLPSQLVTIEWEVSETTLEDEYTIVLEATYETDVPAAVVVAEPVSVTLPDMDEGDVFYGEYTLTNHGLITAEELGVDLPSDQTDYKFELLTDPPYALLAKQQVTVPYRITRLTPLDPDGEDSGGGCITLGWTSLNCYGYKCVNGQWTEACTPVVWTKTFGTCDPGKGGKITYTGTSGPGTGGTYNGPSSSGPVPGTPQCDPCEHPSLSAAEQDCCKHNKTVSSGSAVDLITGQYEDDVDDLAVAALGDDLTMSRYWYGDAWHFQYFETDLFFVESGGEVSEVVHLDVAYSLADDNGGLYEAGGNTIALLPDGTWRFEDQVGSWRNFDADGALTAFGDRNDARIELVRDAGDIVALNDTFGQTLVTYEYDPSSGRVAAVEAWDGRRVEYTWDGGDLVLVEQPGEQLVEYGYDSQGRMVFKRYPNGKERHIAWSSGGVVASVLDEAGQGMYFDYGYNQATEQNYAATIYTDGTVHEKWFDADGNLVQETIDDAEVKETDATVDLVVDDDGNVLGTAASEDQQASSYEYGDFGLVSEITDERGITYLFEYDARGNLTRRTDGVARPDERVTEFTYDDAGRRLTETRVGGGGVPDATWTFTYDDFGNLVSVVDPEQHETTATYDAAGKPLTITNPEGDVMQYTRDDVGRVTEQRLTPADGSPDVIVTTVYEPRLDPAGAVIGTRRIVTNPAGEVTTAEYDTEDRLVALTDHWGRTESRQYDGQGRLAQATDADGRVTVVTYEDLGFGNDRQTTTVDGSVTEVLETDVYGRTTSRTTPAEGTTTYFYSGADEEPLEIVRPGAREQQILNDLGRVVGRTFLPDEDPEAVFGEAYTWSGRYQTGYTSATSQEGAVEVDPNGQLLSRTFGPGHTELWQRDARGRLVTMTDPAGHDVLTLTYDANDEVATRTFAEGGGVAYARDGRGFVTEVEHTGDGGRILYTHNADGQATRVEVYDAADPVTPSEVVDTTYDHRGRVTSSVSDAVAWTIAYDDFERTRTDTWDFGTFARSITTRTDSLGRTIAYTDPDGLTYSYAYHPDGSLAAVTIPDEGDIALARAPLTETVTYPNGVTWEATTTGLGVPATITATDADATPLLGLTYTADAYRITGIETLTGAYTYGYDGLDQLTSASYPTLPAETFAYDAGGNRADWTHDTANRLLDAGDLGTFTYDDRGNLATWQTASTTRTFTFNAANQLRQITDDSGLVATYAYDSAGHRVTKTTPTGTTHYLYGPEGLLAILDADGDTFQTFLWRPGTTFQSAPLAVRNGLTHHYLHPDAAGTVRLATGPDGTPTWRAEHEAFGRAHPDPTNTLTLDLRASSQLHDPETGFHYNLYRAYAPSLGRYLSTEPLLERAERTNFYAFADNDPIQRADRTGLDSKGSATFGNDGTFEIGGEHGNGTGKFSIDGDGNFTVGGGAKVGGYAGLGGEAMGGAEVSRKDCCKKEPGKQGQVIQGGQTCFTTYGGAEGGVGAGVSGAFAGASGKLGTVGGEHRCSLCNQCGTLEPSYNCCDTFEVKVLSGEVFLIFAAELTVYSYKKTVCYGTDGFTTDGGSDWFGGRFGLGFSRKGKK